MSVPVELASLAIYLLQQLGVMLGVGAMTIILVSYLLSFRDGVVEEKEAKFGSALANVIKFSLILILVSGLGALLFHAVRGDGGVLASAAFLYKWALIATLVIGILLQRSKPYAKYVGEGFMGANWYALFILHIFAPADISLFDIAVVHGVWLTGFLLVWTILVYLLRKKVALPPVAESKHAIPHIVVKEHDELPRDVPAPLPALIQPTSIITVPAAVPLAPIAPIKSQEEAKEKNSIAHEASELPALHIMPRTPEEMHTRMRPAVVKFNQG